MNTQSIIALFIALTVLAFIPSISVLTVSTRSAAYGFLHGVFTTLGIVLGDIIFILIAIFGLSVLVDTLGNVFNLIKYMGGVYLVWIGIGLWRSKQKHMEIQATIKPSLLSSFLSGLFITLADQKAILFYLGFFPAFFDLSTLSYIDVGIIITIATFAVGSAKLCYAYMADKASVFISPTVNKSINIITGSVMVTVGLFLIIKP